MRPCWLPAFALALAGCGGGSPAAPDAAAEAASAPGAPDTAPPLEAAGAARDGAAAETAGATDASAAASQTPPQGRAALDPWLAQGHHLRWRCEAAISPPRANGAHGRTRICVNDALARSAGPEHPVGAAAVKELYGSGDAITGYAVSLKVAPGSAGTSWYFYERAGTAIYADGVNVGLCANCHRLAGTMDRGGMDFVYVIVR